MRLVWAAVTLAFATLVGALCFELGTRSADSAQEPAQGRHELTAGSGAVVRIPAIATNCEVTQEGGVPNFFCTPDRREAGYQVVFWRDRLDVHDLARVREPMRATYSVPAVHCGKIAHRGRRLDVDLAEGEFPLACPVARAVVNRFLGGGRSFGTVRHGKLTFECRTARPDREGWDYHCEHSRPPHSGRAYVDVGAGRRPILIR